MAGQLRRLLSVLLFIGIGAIALYFIHALHEEVDHPPVPETVATAPAATASETASTGAAVTGAVPPAAEDEGDMSFLPVLRQNIVDYGRSLGYKPTQEEVALAESHEYLAYRGEKTSKYGKCNVGWPGPECGRLKDWSIPPSEEKQFQQQVLRFAKEEDSCQFSMQKCAGGKLEAGALGKCAVVGISDSLGRNGTWIDSHDSVFRMAFLPMPLFKDRAGLKTSYVICRPYEGELKHCLSDDPSKILDVYGRAATPENFPEGYGRLLHVLTKVPPDMAKRIRKEVGGKMELSLTSLRFPFVRLTGGYRPTSGFVLIYKLFVSKLCKTMTVFGMSPDRYWNRYFYPIEGARRFKHVMDAVHSTSAELAVYRILGMQKAPDRRRSRAEQEYVTGVAFGNSTKVHKPTRMSAKAEKGGAPAPAKTPRPVGKPRPAAKPRPAGAPQPAGAPGEKLGIRAQRKAQEELEAQRRAQRRSHGHGHGHRHGQAHTRGHVHTRAHASKPKAALATQKAAEPYPA